MDGARDKKLFGNGLLQFDGLRRESPARGGLKDEWFRESNDGEISKKRCQTQIGANWRRFPRRTRHASLHKTLSHRQAIAKSRYIEPLSEFRREGRKRTGREVE